MLRNKISACSKSSPQQKRQASGVDHHHSHCHGIVQAGGDLRRSPAQTAAQSRVSCQVRLQSYIKFYSIWSKILPRVQRVQPCWETCSTAWLNSEREFPYVLKCEVFIVFYASWILNIVGMIHFLDTRVTNEG